MPTQSGWITLFQVLGSIATAAAFWVTYLSLVDLRRQTKEMSRQTDEMRQQTEEMRRQTELANDPLLRLRFRYRPSLEIDVTTVPGSKLFKDHYSDEAHTKWLAIVTINLVNHDLTGLTYKYSCH